MSILQLGNKLEIERQNNKALKDGMLASLDSLQAQVRALHSQTVTMVEQLDKLSGDLYHARAATEAEMNNRDEALRVIIEGDAA